MRRIDITTIGLRAVLPALAALCVAACATSEPASEIKAAKLSDVFATPDWAKFSSSRPLVSRNITPDDLISAEGRCAGSPEAALAAQGSTDGSAPTTGELLEGQGPLPTIAGGIALSMTECQVAQRAGSPDRVDIGAEGTDRTVMLTYMRGNWPGLYRFRSGRLVSVERVEVPEQPRQKKAAPKKRASAR